MGRPIKLTLKVRVEGEAMVVRDATGTGLSYTYFEDEPIRRQSTSRVTKAKSVEIARAIARTLTGQCAEPESDTPDTP